MDSGSDTVGSVEYVEGVYVDGVHGGLDGGGGVDEVGGNV